MITTLDQLLRKINVFIVDDSEYIAMTLKKILLNMDCNVLGIATSAKEAMAKIEELGSQINIVTLDICLGPIDGMTLIPEILTINPAIKVVMVSSNQDEKLIMKSIYLGAKYYIVKPFNIDDVKRIMYKIATM